MKLMIKSLWRWETAKLSFFFFVIFGGLGIFIFTPSLFPSALISVILFFIFSPIIDAMERKGVPRMLAILGVFFVCGLGIAFSTSRMLPSASKEIETFQKERVRYANRITAAIQANENKLFSKFPVFKEARLTEKLLNWITDSANKLWGSAPNWASQLLVCVLLVPFLTFILLKDAHEIRRSILRLVPNRYFETVYSLIARILAEMGGYVAARILEAGLVSLFVAIGCWALNIPYAILIGLFAGATNPIPYMGPLIGAVPGILFAMLEPAIPNHLFWICFIYLLANVIDMAVIFPLVVAKIVNLHPVVVVISVILGSQLFGIVGMIIAVPITSILKILIQEVYSRIYNYTEVKTN